MVLICHRFVYDNISSLVPGPLFVFGISLPRGSSGGFAIAHTLCYPIATKIFVAFLYCR